MTIVVYSAFSTILSENVTVVEYHSDGVILRTIVVRLHDYPIDVDVLCSVIDEITSKCEPVIKEF